MIATTICSQNGHHLHRSCSPITLLNSLSPTGLMTKTFIFSFLLALTLQHENKRKSRGQADYCGEGIHQGDTLPDLPDVCEKTICVCTAGLKIVSLFVEENKTTGKKSFA